MDVLRKLKAVIRVFREQRTFFHSYEIIHRVFNGVEAVQFSQYRLNSEAKRNRGFQELFCRSQKTAHLLRGPCDRACVEVVQEVLQLGFYRLHLSQGTHLLIKLRLDGLYAVAGLKVHGMQKSVGAIADLVPWNKNKEKYHYFNNKKQKPFHMKKRGKKNYLAKSQFSSTRPGMMAFLPVWQLTQK